MACGSSSSEDKHGGFPGFERLFAVADPMARRHFLAEVEEGMTFELCREIVRAERALDRPLHFNWVQGSDQPADIVWVAGFSLLVSEKVVGALENSDFSGWRTFDVTLTGKRGETIDGYAGLSVYGRCGPIDDSRSTVADEEYPGGWFPVYRGMFFDPESWDGSDVFMEQAEGIWPVIITDRVRSVLEKLKIRNVNYERLDRIQRPGLHLPAS